MGVPIENRCATELKLRCWCSLPKVLGETHKIAVRILDETFPLTTLNGTDPIPSLAWRLEKRPARRVQGGEDRIQALDHDLEVHPSPEGILHVAGIPSLIMLAEHDVCSASNQVGEASGRSVIGDGEAEKLTPKPQAGVEIVDAQFWRQGRKPILG